MQGKTYKEQLVICTRGHCGLKPKDHMVGPSWRKHFSACLSKDEEKQLKEMTDARD